MAGSAQEFPTCAVCALRLAPSGTEKHPYDQCPGCGHVELPIREASVPRPGAVGAALAALRYR